MCDGQLQVTVFGEQIYASIYEKATMLLIQLIKKHPFNNANKRTAFLALFVLLKINGYLLTIPEKKSNWFSDKYCYYNGDFNQLKEEVLTMIKTYTEAS